MRNPPPGQWTVGDALKKAGLGVLLQESYSAKDLIGRHELLPDDLKVVDVVPFYVVMAASTKGSDHHYWTIKPVWTEGTMESSKFTTLAHDGMGVGDFQDAAWHKIEDCSSMSDWVVHSVVFMPKEVHDHQHTYMCIC